MQTHGFPKGLWLTVKRLCRCLPWVPLGTYDPVPPPLPAKPQPVAVRHAVRFRNRFSSLRRIEDTSHNLAHGDFRMVGMNSSTKDKIEGNIDQAKGAVKEKTGEAIGNPNLRDRGAAEKASGKIQEKVGDIKKVFEK
jgi:uncharacterized protein YjbJ (UPF0337 family)